MTFLRAAALLAAFLGVACVAAPVDEVVTPEVLADIDYRLPHTISPMNYTITLEPHLEESDGSKQFTFDGEVFINITTNAATNEIIMHTKNLNYTVREYWQYTNPNETTQLISFVADDTTDKINYTLASNLVPNNIYVLHFVYTGSMDDDMRGFYRSSYTDSNNNTKWLGSTQFQTNHARRAFPCFDEPRFKATFQVNIRRPQSMKSISNTRLVSSTRYENKYLDVFEQTPNMSTYLVAFLVSDFNERSNGQFAIVARPEYYAQTEYSFDVGQKILSEFDSYLALPYYNQGIDKMHMAAIPDFSSGAMENWGMLTYRERGLLYDVSSTTLSSKQYIAAVIAHEQAHMWFGDLVTCDWWSYTWLNEGFARYFQYFMTAKVETAMEFEKQFVVDQVQTVMNMDSTNSTNPMSNEDTNSPTDLSTMFNSISYNKGASFIRMVRHAMGEQNFQNSLQEYLNTHKYKNTKPEDLFTVWEKHWPEATRAHAPLIFASFTEQVGYPVISVTVSGTSVTLKQKRFLLKDGDGSDASLLYTVPFTYTTNLTKDFETTTPQLFLSNTTAEYTFTLPSNVSWFVANIQETGYYRVNYDTASWHKIHHSLYNTDWDGIHEINRAQVVDDLFNLARAGEIEYSLAFDVLEYLETEVHYVPWTAAFNGFSYLVIRLGEDTANFGPYIRYLMEKVYTQLGFEELATDSPLDIYNRAKVLAWSCKFGNTDCISKAQTYFNNMDNTPVPVNIRSPVYCTAMREGSSEDFETLFNKYKASTVPTDQTLILSALGCVKEQTLIERYFWIIVSDDVRRQDKSSALTSLYTENNENVSPVFELVTKNYEQLAEAMGSYSSVASVISSIASRFTEEDQKKDLEAFNAEHKSKFGTASATLEAAEVTVAENLAWSANKLGTFKEFLENRNNGSNAVSAFTILTTVLLALAAMLLR